VRGVAVWGSTVPATEHDTADGHISVSWWKTFGDNGKMINMMITIIAEAVSWPEAASMVALFAFLSFCVWTLK
jgi:hypothetical protein